MRIAVVIPTYKEIENIKILVKRILASLPNALIIIVDDSPQEENKLLRDYLQSFKNSVKILSRLKKEGRGTAVVTGFKEALKNKDINFFFEMDADLAHSPEEIILFLNKKDHADVIIGSRYLSESKITKWPMKRLILSKAINFFLKLWLDLQLTDYTNGFRMYNRKSLEFICSTVLKEKGFIALSEIAYKLKKAGFTIVEIPISFKDRTYGKSNAGFTEHLNSLIGVIRIRFAS